MSYEIYQATEQTIPSAHYLSFQLPSPRLEVNSGYLCYLKMSASILLGCYFFLRLLI